MQQQQLRRPHEGGPEQNPGQIRTRDGHSEQGREPTSLSLPALESSPPLRYTDLEQYQQHRAYYWTSEDELPGTPRSRHNHHHHFGTDDAPAPASPNNAAAAPNHFYIFKQQEEAAAAAAERKLK